jgi:SHS2 domain-containing protein
MLKYKFVKGPTSDVMYEAYGKNLKEIFENAALGLLSVICDIKKVKPKEKEEFLMKGTNAEELLINWLQGVIAVVDVEQKFYSKVEVLEVDENHVKAALYGEPMTPKLGKTVVKAVTYYKFKLEQNKKGFKATVSLDI